MSVKNALELSRLGRLSPRDGAAFEVVHRTEYYRLRHYGSGRGPDGAAPALLLVPPLMLTAEIYDVDQDLSAVRELVTAGLDVWVVDFGAPEREAGGMQRTLDDHVRSVVDAVRVIGGRVARAVHLAGYSQGGLFCYQAAAFLRSDGVASIITFGSPVDIHRALPRVRRDLTARLIRATRPFVERPLSLMDGLPGKFSSVGFRLFSARREVRELVEFLRLLHDRRALEKREHRRRFLAGEGFVAWPGPALMKFLDDFVVHNRFMSGGFVVDGRTITLADIHCPILSFVGTRDEIARPASVRAIREVVPAAEVFEVPIPAGHFGLVVGTVAMRDSWPTVIEWIHWQDGSGPRPRLLSTREMAGEEPEDTPFDLNLDLDLFYDVVRRSASSVSKWLGDRAEDLGDAADQARFQLPRLLRLRELHDDTETSVGRELARRAARHGSQTFFLYEGRAVSYADVNRRVEAVVRGLIASGIRPNNLVGIVMGSRPSFLSLVVALNRLGAVAVIIPPSDDAEALSRAVQHARVEHVFADPGHAEVVRLAAQGRVFVLGSGRSGPLPEGVVDLEQINPDEVTLPAWYRANKGRAEDLAFVFVTVAHEGRRAVRVTNRRWAISAFGASAACTISPDDTVYSSLPLHHPTGLLVSASAAIAGGARLALSPRFDPAVFWDEVRRYGATIAFYAGDMCRHLVDAPTMTGERTHPLRLLAGSGMRKDVWVRLRERFQVGVLEFYASTQVNLVLANASGEKVGSIGRPLPGSRETFLAKFDAASGDVVRDAQGWAVPAEVDEPGVFLVLVDPMARSPLDESALDTTTLETPRIVRDVRAKGDAWYTTLDLLRRDADGDHFFVGGLSDSIRTPDGLVAARSVEDALYELPEVERCAAYALERDGRDVVAAAIVVRAGATLSPSAIASHLGQSPLRPNVIRFVADLPESDGFRPLKNSLRRSVAPFAPGDGRSYEYDASHGEYRRIGRG